MFLAVVRGSNPTRPVTVSTRSLSDLVAVGSVGCASAVSSVLPDVSFWLRHPFGPVSLVRICVLKEMRFSSEQ